MAERAEALGEWLEPPACAVVVVDMQNDYCATAGYLASQGTDIAPIRQIVGLIAGFVSAARAAGVLIAYTQNTTLAGDLNVSPAYRHFRKRTRPGLGPYPVDGTWGHAICSELEVRPQDLVISKFRPSAFFGTSLDMLLQNNGCRTLLICGTATEGCVESTVRDAANHDYLPIVVPDCVASSKLDLHKASMTVMTSRYNAIPSEELIDHWRTVTAKAEAKII